MYDSSVSIPVPILFNLTNNNDALAFAVFPVCQNDDEVCFLPYENVLCHLDVYENVRVFRLVFS